MSNLAHLQHRMGAVCRNLAWLFDNRHFAVFCNPLSHSTTPSGTGVRGGGSPGSPGAGVCSTASRLGGGPRGGLRGFSSGGSSLGAVTPVPLWRSGLIGDVAASVALSAGGGLRTMGSNRAPTLLRLLTGLLPRLPAGLDRLLGCGRAACWMDSSACTRFSSRWMRSAMLTSGSGFARRMAPDVTEGRCRCTKPSAMVRAFTRRPKKNRPLPNA